MKDKKGKVEKSNIDNKIVSIIKLNYLNTHSTNVDQDSFIFKTFLKSYLIENSPLQLEKYYEFNVLNETFKFKIISAKISNEGDNLLDFSVNLSTKIEINSEGLSNENDLNDLLRIASEKFKTNCKIYRKIVDLSTKMNELILNESVEDESEEIFKFIKLALRKDNLDTIKSKNNISSKFVFKGLILSGEHGSGKTHYFEKAINRITSENECEYICVFKNDTTDLDTFKTYINFSKMIKNSVIIISNEITHKLTNNSEETSLINEDNKFALELVKEIDNNSSIFIIETTHSCEDFYKELRLPGRFDYNININLPDFQKRTQIIKEYLLSLSHKLNDIEIVKLVDKTQGFTPADIFSVLK